MKYYAHIMVCGVIALLTSCASITADFVWTPQEPRAGATVQFQNLSNDGEYFNWSFGDGATSLLVSPTKIYTRPGVYNVSLRVDSTNRFSVTKQITIYDTVPFFTLDDTTGLHYFTPNTITPRIYNPAGYALKYEWQFPTSARGKYIDSEGKSTNTVQTSMTAYFTEHDVPVTISCRISLLQNGDVKRVFDIDTTLYVHDTPARSLLIGAADGTLYRQRIYELGYENPVTVEGTSWTATSCQLAVSGENIRVYDVPACNYLGTDYYASDYASSATAICCTPQRIWCSTADGIQTFDMQTKEYTAHLLAGTAISSIAVDAVNQKVYYVADNKLYCSNYDGGNATLAIADIAADGPLCIDNLSNRLFWTSGSKIYSATLVTNGYNRLANPAIFCDGIAARALTLDPNRK